MCNHRTDSSATKQATACAAPLSGLTSSGLHDQYVTDLRQPGMTTEDILNRVSGLTNEIHPIFAENLWMDFEVWRGEILPCPKDLFSLLEPCLRLASLILTHDDALSFWHGLIVAGRQHDKEGRKNHNPSFSAKEQLTEQEKKDTLDFLIEMSKKLAYLVAFESGALGSTTELEVLDDEDEYDPTKTLWKGFNDVIQEDWCARIILDRGMVNMLTEWTAPGSKRSVYEIRSLIFWIAVTFVHEIAHAIQGSFYTLNVAPMFDNFSIDLNETGWQFEAYLLGGTIDTTETGLLRVWRYPDPRSLEVIRDEGYNYCFKGEVSKMSRHWTVPSGYLNRFFTPKFWADSDNGTRGQLHLPVLAVTESETEHQFRL